MSKVPPNQQFHVTGGHMCVKAARPSGRARWCWRWLFGNKIPVSLHGGRDSLICMRVFLSAITTGVPHARVFSLQSLQGYLNLRGEF